MLTLSEGNARKQSDEDQTTGSWMLPGEQAVED